MTCSKKIWKCIGRGFNGWHAKGVGVSSSGGSLNSRVVSGTPSPGYLDEACENALVYDAAHLESVPEHAAAYYTHVIRGAVLGVSLENGTYKPCGQNTAFDCPPTYTPGPLDLVALDVYEGLLRALPGPVRIGRVCNGVIEWEAQ